MSFIREKDSYIHRQKANAKQDKNTTVLSRDCVNFLNKYKQDYPSVELNFDDWLEFFKFKCNLGEPTPCLTINLESIKTMSSSALAQQILQMSYHLSVGNVEDFKLFIQALYDNSIIAFSNHPSANNCSPLTLGGILNIIQSPQSKHFPTIQNVTAFISSISRQKMAQQIKEAQRTTSVLNSLELKDRNLLLKSNLAQLSSNIENSKVSLTLLDHYSRVNEKLFSLLTPSVWITLNLEHQLLINSTIAQDLPKLLNNYLSLPDNLKRTLQSRSGELLSDLIVHSLSMIEKELHAISFSPTHLSKPSL